MVDIQQYKSGSKEDLTIADSLFLVWKWKIVIICMTSIVVVMGTCYTIFKDKEYRISIDVKLHPLLFFQKNNEKKPIDPIDELSSVLRSGYYNDNVVQNIKGNKGVISDRLTFDTLIDKASGRLETAIISTKPDQAIDILTTMVFFLNGHMALLFSRECLPNLKVGLEKVGGKIRNKQNEIAYVERQKLWKIDDLSRHLFYLQRVNSGFDSLLLLTEKELNRYRDRLLLREKGGGSDRSKNLIDISTVEKENDVLSFSESFDRFENPFQPIVYQLSVKKREIMNKKAKLTYEIGSLEASRDNLEQDSLMTKKELNQEVEALQKTYQKIVSEIAEFRNAEKNTQLVSIVDRPVVTLDRTPNLFFVMLMSLISGFSISVLCVFMFDFFRNIINSNPGVVI